MFSDDKKRYVSENAIQKLIKHPYCCNSCHDDADDYGYDLIELTPEELGKNRWAEVCCEVANMFKEWCSKSE